MNTTQNTPIFCRKAEMNALFYDLLLLDARRFRMVRHFARCLAHPEQAKPRKAAEYKGKCP